MPSGSYMQVDVLCPFYLSDDGKKRLECEGVEKGTRCVTVFCSEKSRERLMGRLCCDKWKQCALGQAVGKKYEEDEK